MMRITIVVLFTVLGCVSCRTENEWNAFMTKAYAEFNEARQTANASRLAEFYSADAKILRDGEVPLYGKSAVKAMLTRHFEGKLQIVLTFEGLVFWNDVGAVVEDSAVVITGDGKESHTKGLRVFVIEDDQPKISLSIWNANA